MTRTENFKAETIRAHYRRAGISIKTPGSEIQRVMTRHNLSVDEMAAYMNTTPLNLIRMAERKYLSPIPRLALYLIDKSLSNEQ